MQKVNRRQFIGSTAAASIAVPALFNTAKAQPSPIKIGLIGCGGYGMSNIRAAFKVGGVEVIAVCDVDSEHLEDSADKIKAMQDRRPKICKHYQELLETPTLQAVIIGTPPHWHALQFIAALEKGLDIYCEKPLAYDIREGQAMVAAAKKSDSIVQIGFQRRQSGAIQQTREYVQSGKLGRIVHVEVQIHYTAGMKDATPQDPPASLDWDLWCGPSPRLPYSPQIGHVSWRLEKETGHGHLVDWGIHLIDATRVILNETMPTAVTATGGIYYFKDQITTPDILTAHFDFATCPVTWRHHIWGAREYTPPVSNGIFLYGEKGTIFVTDHRWEIIPRGNDAEKKVMDVPADMGTEHMRDFLEAVRTRKPALVSPLDALYSTASTKLAMISYETGRKIRWDLDRFHIPDDPAAAALLKRDYRAPWKHPYES